MTSQAPHAHRTLFALVAGLPEENIRIVTCDIGGGFGNKVPIYPGYVVATAASLVLGKPVKWVEYRSENLISTGFARDYHMHGELALDERREDPRPARARSCPTRARSTPTPSRRSSGPGCSTSCTGSYDMPAAHVAARRRLHEQGARRRGLPVLVPGHRGLVPHRAARGQNAAYELGMDPAEFAGRRTSSARTSSRTRRPPGSSTTPATTTPRCDLAMDKSATTAAARRRASGTGAERPESQADRHRPRLVHRGRRRRQLPGLRHRRDQDVRLRRAAHPPDGQGHPEDRRADPGPGPRDDVRPDRGARSSASRPRTSRCSTATPTTRPTAWAPTRPARRRSAAPRPRWSRASCGRRPASSPRTCSRSSEDDLEWEPGTFTVSGHRPRGDDPGRRVRRLHQPPRGDGGRAGGRAPTTTRRT